MLVRNWEGEMVEAPEDLETTLGNVGEGRVVWSFHEPTGVHRVRYGLQSTIFSDSRAAADEFVSCVFHHFECEGMLDTTE